MFHDFVEMFDGDKAAPKLHAEIRKLIGRWLGDVERRLENRTWIACDDFTDAARPHGVRRPADAARHDLSHRVDEQANHRRGGDNADR